MEYCNHGDLSSILKSDYNEFTRFRSVFGGFDNVFLSRFIHDIGNAISYLHDNKIIHRDIKLHNILVQTIETVNDFPYIFKLSDFGFACEDVTIDTPSCFDSDILKKKYFKICGTPYYMSPELLLNSEEIESSENDHKRLYVYDTKSDLWSFGICLSELMFTTLPFTSVNSVSDLKYFFCNTNSQKLLYDKLENNDNISKDIKVILKNLLTISPKNRWSTKELSRYVKSLSKQVDTKLVKKKPLEPIINLESWDIIDVNDDFDSWNKIDTSGSIILKMSLTKAFTEWLLQKR